MNSEINCPQAHFSLLITSCEELVAIDNIETPQAEHFLLEICFV